MTAQRARSTYNENITQVTGPTINGGAGLPMLPGTQAVYTTLVRGQREMLDFVTMRLEKDREVMQEASGCRTLTDAIALQSRWMQEIMRDYAAETTRMLALYTGAATQNGEASSAESRPRD